jgi:hypothetical protein
MTADLFRRKVGVIFASGASGLNTCCEDGDLDDSQRRSREMRLGGHSEPTWRQRYRRDSIHNQLGGSGSIFCSGSCPKQR